MGPLKLKLMAKKKRIQKKNIDIKIYENLMELYNGDSKKVNRKFKFIKLKHELNS